MIFDSHWIRRCPSLPGCSFGPTGNMCVYGDLLLASPACCDFFRQCEHNVEWERPCQEGEDGIRMWFDQDLQVNHV